MIPIAIDTESFLITRANPSPKNVCLTWSDGEDSGIVHHTDVEQFMMDLIDDENTLFIGHNIAFDMCSLCTSYPDLMPFIFAIYEDGRVTDTMLRQQLFDIAIGRVYSDNDKVNRYTLERLWETLFETKPLNWESKIKKNPDSWRLRYGELYDVPLEDWPDSSIEYAELDAIMTWEIYNCQETEAGDYFRDDCFQAYAYFCLNWISINGMTTSPSKTLLFEREQKCKYESFIKRLSKAGLIEKKKDGTWTKKQKPTQERILTACKKIDREPFITKTGKKLCRKEYPDSWPSYKLLESFHATPEKYIATDKPAVYWSEDELLLDRLKFVEAEKMLTTYIPVLKKGYEWPISSRFEIAATGRTTSSGQSGALLGTNLQNWPRETNARNCFIPRDGFLFLSADFSGAELHTLAQTCFEMFGQSSLGQALNDGLDVHLYVASIIENITYKEAKRRLKEGDKKIKDSRFYAKMANFGFGGGMMPRTWCYNQLQKTGMIIDYDFGKQLRNNWLKAWIEMSRYFQHAKNLLQRNPGGITLELEPLKRLSFVDKYTVLCNRYFQARAADGAKLALCEVIKKCYVDEESTLFGCKPVNFVHDELMLEIPDYSNLKFRDNIIKEFITTMENAFNEVVPDFPTKVDAVLMDCWNKNAKKLIDIDGHWVCDRSC